MRLYRLILAAIVCLTITATMGQTVSPHHREISDHGMQGMDVTWHFGEVTTHPVVVENQVYNYLRMQHFTHTKEVGKPALPCYNELIAIPQGADVTIRIIKANYTDHPAEHRVHPALQPAVDTYGAAEPDFEIDELFYKTDQFYPKDLVMLEGIQYWRELSFGVFTLFPVQYNPVQKIIRVYTELEFEIEFTGGTHFLDLSQHSEHFLSMVARPFLNGGSLQEEIKQQGAVMLDVPVNPDYIIITHMNYVAAAERLAAWKRQLGHKVEIIDGTGMTSAAIKNAVYTRYQNWTPKPDYLLIIGDHPDISGQLINGSYGTFASDLYYVCTGSGNDFVADMARGRISVSTTTEANNVVNKIIQYEMAPPEDSSFYNHSVHAAYFQHQGNGYAERRFAQTAEEIRDYMVNIQGYDVTRIYYTESSVNPTNWNNGSYSAGEPIPLYLRKPTFPWTGNASQINAELNNGAFYIMHRDHGSEDGWGDPAYTSTNVNALTNGNKTPIVMTINCLTGKYYYGECFSERFLRKYPGGAVGVFGHAEVSLSGYNDALAFGLFDAIWASPGCIPVFTGSGGINLVNPPQHAKIFTMGDAANHALIRMTQTWGTHQYTNELLHYFGDPAMRIYTRKPVQTVAVHTGPIQCGQDTSLSIFSTNCPNGLATLVVDNELVARTQLVNGAAILTFQQLSGPYAILTLSDSNCIAFVDTIIITGGCPKSKFIYSATKYCIAETVQFTNQSTGTINSYVWNFGAGAMPATATGPGPHNVNYATGGNKTITLQVTGTASHTSTAVFFMDSVCRFFVPAAGSDLITLCHGELKDDGGDQNYSNSASGSITISPPGASSVNLLFCQFSFQNNTDYLRIYNGPSTSSPLIAAYTGYALPNGNGMVSSNAGSITIQQVTNASNNYPGFRLTFACAYPNSAPQTNFILSDSNTCTGQFTFTDLSFNGPVSWLWDFGDGNTSTQQHPQHQYQQNGTYDIKLVTTNTFGSDSLIMYGYVTVNMPVSPLVPDVARCKEGKVVLQASANGNILWYDLPSGGQLVASGNTFVTPNLTQTTSYYVETEISAAPVYGGKPDNSGDGANLSYEHYLVFNSLKPFKLKSVLVYAQGAGNRTIQLRNSSGNVLQTATINIPTGTSRVTLNFDVPIGTNLRLVCSGTPNLYRNSGGLAYPYSIPGLISIHSSSATSNPTGYYYFFYDWEIQEESCLSSRVKVNAIISDSLKPTPLFTHTINTNQVQFNNQSVYADSYLWSFGDGDYSVLQHPFHVYQTPAQYAAVLFATNECGTDSLQQIIDILTGIEEPGHTASLSIHPNPARHEVIISFHADMSGDASIALYDLSGRMIIQQNESVSSGPNIHHLNVSSVPSGVYLLQLKENEQSRFTKLIVAP